MTPKRVAAIDLGTNSALLCVVESHNGKIRLLKERCEVPRLGEGLDRRGSIAAEAAERTLAVLRDYVRVAKDYGAVLRAVGTQALREAKGSSEFLSRVHQTLGSPLEVIDGAREAHLACLAVTRSFPEFTHLVVVDIGGGSTEVVRSHGGSISSLVSLPMGSVRLTERTLCHDPPTHDEFAAAWRTAEAAFAEIAPALDSATVVGVAGTVTTLASVALGLERYDADLVHGSRLSRTEVERQIALVLPMTVAERRQVRGMDPRRADVILGGAIVVATMFKRLGCDSLVVSDRGVRWGLVYEMLDA